MGKRANGEGTLYKTIQKNKRKTFLEVECAVCKNCTDRIACNNRIGYDKCDKCKNCKTECLKYCDRFYCKETWLGQATVNGKLRTLSTSSKQKDAISKKQQQSEKIKSGIYFDKSSLTLIDLCREEIEVRNSKGKTKPTSHLRLLETLKRLEISDFTDFSLQELNDKELLVPSLQKFFSNIKINYSKSVINKIYQLINAGIKRAIKYKIILLNPLQYDDDLEKPKSSKPTKKVRAFTVSEQQTFVKVLSENDVLYKYQYLISLFSGMRMGEINALDKDNDINFTDKVIYVRRTITKDSNDKSIIGETCKTLEGVRKVTITPLLEKILKTVISKWKPNKDNLLFYDYRADNCISTSAVNCAFKRLCEKYQITNEQVNQHMLRHTYATRAIESGIDVDVLAKLLGHTDIKITLNTYCDVFAKRQSQQLELMQEYLDNENLSIAL